MSEYDEGFEESDYDEELADEYGDIENDNVTDEYLAYLAATGEGPFASDGGGGGCMLIIVAFTLFVVMSASV
ncbi:hypothetical protein OAO39_01415 [Pirellulaceae bacterium]|nr:hypothetical protein [Pirellulaceae bacterium]